MTAAFHDDVFIVGDTSVRGSRLYYAIYLPKHRIDDWDLII